MATVKARQTKDGEVRYWVRFRLNGMQSSQTFDTEAEAAEFVQLIDDLGSVADALRYTERVADAKVQQALTLDRWFAEFKDTRTGTEPRTLIDYQRVYDRHIKPTLGKRPIDAIDKAAVATLINKLAVSGLIRKGKPPAGLSAKTIANVHGLLSASLNEAVSQRKIDVNPCIGMRLPRTGEDDKDEARFLTHDEYNALEDTVPDRWVPLVRTLVGTGMRWGELTALRVGEVNLDALLPTIRIVRATKWIPGEGHRDGVPKTKKSRRTVVMPPQVVEVLRPLCEGREGDEYVFTGVKGGQVRHSGFWRLVWTPACKAAGLVPAPRLHDLRHTHASWLIEGGIGLEAIQDQLGHESILTTRKVYGHLQPAMREALAAAAGVALAMGRPAIESAE